MDLQEQINALEARIEVLEAQVKENTKWIAGHPATLPPK